MKSEIKDYWKTYFGRAVEWANNLNPGITGAALEVGLPMPTVISTTIAKIGLPIFKRSAEFDIKDITDYLNDMSKPIKNPYVYHQIKNIDRIDAKWLDIIIKGRTNQYEYIMNEIDSSTKEMMSLKPEYPIEHLIKLIRYVVFNQK